MDGSLPSALSQISDFVFKVITSWVAIFTAGFVQLILWMWEHYYGKSISWKVSKWTFVIFLVVAFYVAWYEERAAYTKTDRERSELSVKLGNRDTEIAAMRDQIRNQQTTINESLVQLGKAQQREPLKITSYFLGVIPSRISPKIAAHAGHFIVLANQTVTPVRLLVSCDNELVRADGAILGTGASMSGGWGGRVTNSKNEIGIGILSPAWTPTNPLLLTLYTNQDINCSFSQR